MFSIPLLPLIQSDTPISSITVSGLASWMTFNVATSTIELAIGYTAVPPPPQNYTITINAINAVGTGTGTIGINVFTEGPPVVSGPSSILHTIGLTQTANYTATNNPTSWSITYALGLTIAGGATGATVTMDSTFDIDSVYTIYAHNAGGTGTIDTNIINSITLNPLYWDFISTTVGTIYGSVNIDIYDAPSGGTLVGSMNWGGDLSNNQSGSFNITGSLADGNMYYAQGSINWGYITGYYDTTSNVSTAGWGTQFIDFNTGATSYQTSTRLEFMYNIASPNTIAYNLVTTF